MSGYQVISNTSNWSGTGTFAFGEVPAPSGKIIVGGGVSGTYDSAQTAVVNCYPEVDPADGKSRLWKARVQGGATGPWSLTVWAIAVDETEEF